MVVRIRVLVFILLFFAGGPLCHAEGSVDLVTCVNWDYDHRESLHGWRNTAALIESALRQWGLSISASRTWNEGEEGLRGFKKEFLTSSSSDIRLFYLASHQSPDGQLEHPDGTRQRWTEGWRQDRAFSILLLDACHAGGIPENHWNQPPPFDLVVTASGQSEKTYELRMFSRRPMDYRRRYPEVVEWMRQELGDEWDGRVSFLGFLFVRQFLETSSAPDTPMAWRTFLLGLEEKAVEFSRGRGNRFASTLEVWPK